MIKVAVITTNRADYGLLQPLIENLDNDNEVDLQLFVTGSHLDDDYGKTISEIIDDKAEITETIKIPSPDSDTISTNQSISVALLEFEKTIIKHQPEWVVVLGDRFEMFAFALSAFLAKKRIAHISGGEVTSGAIDDTFRHSISKMSELHFTSHEVYRKRVIQLGEQPANVFNVGALSTENISKFNDVNPFPDIDIPKDYKVAICTIHPVTNGEDANDILDILFSELIKIDNLFVVFTASNMDEGGDYLNTRIKDYCLNNVDKSVCYRSLGKDKYYSALKRIDFLIGNSSSGLTEAPLFSLPSINIGTRQNGRLFPPSVIQCEISKDSFNESVFKALENKKIESYRYGDGKTSNSIISVIKEFNKTAPKIKIFYDNISG